MNILFCVALCVYVPKRFIRELTGVDVLSIVNCHASLLLLIVNEVWVKIVWDCRNKVLFYYIYNCRVVNTFFSLILNPVQQQFELISFTESFIGEV